MFSSLAVDGWASQGYFQLRPHPRGPHARIALGYLARADVIAAAT
jgi:hypothetical protein